MQGKEVWPWLIRRTQYAVNNQDDGDVHKTYGQAAMAHSLGAITKEQFYTLNHILMACWINGGADRERKSKEALKTLQQIW